MVLGKKKVHFLNELDEAHLHAQHGDATTMLIFRVFLIKNRIIWENDVPNEKMAGMEQVTWRILYDDFDHIQACIRCSCIILAAVTPESQLAFLTRQLLCVCKN